MADFITELTRQFHGWQDETQYLARSDVAPAVRAAREAVRLVTRGGA